MRTYQIKITLKGSEPKIWRRILVPSELKLSDFHMVIQIIMGWTNSHLHQFIKNRTFYTERMKDDDTWGDMNNVDYRKMNVSDLLTKEKEKIVYEYDFGDSWEHVVTLEKIIPFEENLQCPVCLAGEMSCPPEDCGGIWGYSNMLKILKQPDHEEYEDYLDWLGEEFDPEYFDIEGVNKILKKIKLRKF
jgi:hypothetical protein